jgi:hypothetical protein
LNPVKLRIPRRLLERNIASEVSPAQSGSVFTLELSDEFRNNARNCLRFSQEANSLEAQGYWIAMAQLWFDLATNAEERKTIKNIDPAAANAMLSKDGGKSK